MTTYTNNYTALRRNGYAYTYALVNYATGEVRTSSSRFPSVALRHLYRLMDGEMRAARADGVMCHLVLANCVSGEELAEIKCDFGADRLGYLYDMMEAKGR